MYMVRLYLWSQLWVNGRCHIVFILQARGPNLGARILVMSRKRGLLFIAELWSGVGLSLPHALVTGDETIKLRAKFCSSGDQWGSYEALVGSECQPIGCREFNSNFDSKSAKGVKHVCIATSLQLICQVQLSYRPHIHFESDSQSDFLYSVYLTVIQSQPPSSVSPTDLRKV
jgi:hypothetical protein